MITRQIRNTGNLAVLVNHPIALGIILAGFSLAVGVTAVILADFGMPSWFFVLSQAWLWTLGLPATLGVLVVVRLWGIPGWSTWPLWMFMACAAATAIVFECIAFILLQRVALRVAGGSK
jgi:hypothetical protein